MGSTLYDLRVGFISNAFGGRFALPGAARGDNRWIVPVSAFEAKDLVGHCLVQLVIRMLRVGFDLWASISLWTRWRNLSVGRGAGFH